VQQAPSPDALLVFASLPLRTLIVEQNVRRRRDMEYKPTLCLHSCAAKSYLSLHDAVWPVLLAKKHAQAAHA